MAIPGGAQRQRRRRLVAAASLVLMSAAALLFGVSEARQRTAMRAAHPRIDGRLVVSGLARSVRIDRDRHGVPHIEASTEHEAFFALGFAQAQDRLGQLEGLRRQARGTTAAVEGAGALPADRMARLIDFRGLAARQWPRLDARARRVLEAYAAGVSARIERVKRGAVGPPETLSVPPEQLEAWTPEDSLAIFKLYAWSLGASIDTSLVLSELIEELGATDAGRFFPPQDPERSRGGAATVSRPPAWVGQGAQALRRGLGMAGHGVGSTAFALAGSRTQSGRPILVSDAHFEPTVPPSLYFAQIRADDWDVAGAVLPGVPLFWSGRNAHVAWACVHVGAVVTDLFAETLDPDGARYHDGRDWRPLDERVETLRVEGAPEQTLRVRSTAHGPLLPEEPGGPSGRAIAVSWTGARIDGPSGIGSLLAVARSRDGRELRRALRAHHEPVVAVVFATGEGDGGLQLAGWIPQRSLAPGLLPVPGRASWYDWRDPVAFDALPAASLDDTSRPFVIAADQRFEPATDAGPIEFTWRTGARAARLVALLSRSAERRAGLRELARLQADVGLDRSLEVIERALALLADAELGAEASELARLLSSWNGEATPGSVGSAAYHVFLHTLAEGIFAPRLGAERLARYLALPPVDLESLVLGVLRDARSGRALDGWAERGAVERSVGVALRKSWLALSFRLGSDPRRWSWGRLHPLRFRRLGRGPPIGIAPIPYGGGPHAVQAAAYDAGSPFDVRVAAMARFAVDTGSLDLALTALAPGQSEHRGHAHFAEGLGRWREGRLALLASRRLQVEEASVAQLVLEPVR